MTEYVRLFQFRRIAARLGAMSKEQWDRPEDRAEVGERLRLLELATGINGAEMSRLLGVPIGSISATRTPTPARFVTSSLGRRRKARPREGGAEGYRA
jgi:hypothetical protein